MGKKNQALIVAPSIFRSAIHGVVSMTCFSAIVLYTVWEDLDGHMAWGIPIFLAAGSLLFIPTCAIFMRLMMEVTIDDKSLSQSGPLKVEIPFDEIKAVHFMIFGYSVSCGLFSKHITLPTLLFSLQDRQALSDHLRKVLPKDNPLMRLVGKEKELDS